MFKRRGGEDIVTNEIEFLKSNISYCLDELINVLVCKQVIEVEFSSKKYLTEILPNLK